MKPQGIQKLKHDKILTKGNFPNFVETYNYIVDRVENIKGDYDTDKVYGHIHLDNTDPMHPVIRLENLDGIGTGSGTGSGNVYPEPWTPDFENNTILYPYYQVGTYRALANQSNINLSSILEDSSTHNIYCVINLNTLSAEATEQPIDDYAHFSVQVFSLSSISSDTGETDSDGKPIIQWGQNFFYTCRYPLAPCWEGYNY